MLPSVIKDWNLFIEGYGMAGRAADFNPPKLERLTEEWNAAGMAGPIEIDLGQGPLKIDFNLGGFVVEVLERWAVADPSGIGVRFLAASVAGDGSRTDAVEVAARGRWKSLDFGTVKKKELNKLKVEMPLTYYRYRINNRTIHEIDMISGLVIVNGIDLSAEILAALSINV